MTGQTIWSKAFPACAAGVPQDYVLSSPAVTTGMVDGVSTTEVFIGWGPDGVSSTGCIYDLNGQTGSVIWTYATAAPVWDSPAIMTSNQGRIMVVGDGADQVHAFQVDYSGPLGGTGPHLWQYDTRNDQPPSGYAQYCQTNSEKCGDAVWGSVTEGLVTVNGAPHHYAFVPIGAQENEVGRLEAIDMDNIVSGSPSLAWAFWDPHPSFNNDFGTALTLVDGNGYAQRVFTGMNSGDMYSLDPVTGHMIFDFSTTAHQPQTAGFIHSSATLATVNGRTEVIFGAGCDVSSETNCGGTGSYGYVWAIDAYSTATGGSLIWRTAQLAPTAVDSSPTVVNQGSNAVVFIGLHGGTLLALNPTTGATLWSSYTGMSTIMGSAVAYGGRVFITGGYLSGRSIITGGLAAYRCGACS